MSIRGFELKKVMASPVIIALLLLFIAFNIFFILDNAYFRDELMVLNNMVDEFGYKIDDGLEENLGKYYDEGLDKLNQLSYQKTGKTYESVEVFLNDQYYSISSREDGVYDKEDIDFIEELAIVEGYYHTIGDIDQTYEEIDITEIAEAEIKKCGLSGKAANTVRKQYKKFAKRFNELVENGEHKNLFFMGPVYKMQSLLFRRIFKIFIFEIVVLVVLITAYLVNYEFENNTQLLTYSTKRGRELIIDKLYTSILANVIVVTIVMLTGLTTYFSVFDYSGLWDVPISSALMAEGNIIYMSWWNISFVQFLFFAIGLVYICALIFTGITFIISKFVRNSYIVFFIFIMIFGIGLFPSIAPKSSNAIFISGFTPFFLVVNPHVWFMESGAFTTFKYYELITIVIWSVMAILLSLFCIRGFKRQDIF